MIPEKHLIDLGFIRIKEKLYAKNGGNLSLYRDYRGKEPVSYAYHDGVRIDPEQFKEHHAIVKIEKNLMQEKPVEISY